MLIEIIIIEKYKYKSLMKGRMPLLNYLQKRPKRVEPKWYLNLSNIGIPGE